METCHWRTKNLDVVTRNSKSLPYRCGCAAVVMPGHGQEGVQFTVLTQRGVQEYSEGHLLETLSPTPSQKIMAICSERLNW